MEDYRTGRVLLGLMTGSRRGYETFMQLWPELTHAWVVGQIERNSAEYSTLSEESH